MTNKLIKLSLFSLMLSVIAQPLLGMNQGPSVAQLVYLKPFDVNIKSMNPDVIYKGGAEVDPDLKIHSNATTYALLTVIAAGGAFLAWNQYRMHQQLKSYEACFEQMTRDTNDAHNKATLARQAADTVQDTLDEMNRKVGAISINFGILESNLEAKLGNKIETAFTNIRTRFEENQKDYFEKLNERIFQYNTAHNSQWANFLAQQKKESQQLKDAQTTIQTRLDVLESADNSLTRKVVAMTRTGLLTDGSKQ